MSETLKAYRHIIQKRRISLMDFENKISNFPLKFCNIMIL